ncbi:hypothetical protein BC008_04880 [Mastigocoleus testarum BC008]|uniref:Uncharacterized protein n=1 Tax=Mastigocoleus testarum BC008 TaxID=371196 RepID=A0A0V7ZYL6_9CYAN|nr:hypothetical protein BC008_04880 [Mastigocoleus testarum BC008]
MTIKIPLSSEIESKDRNLAAKNRFSLVALKNNFNTWDYKNWNSKNWHFKIGNPITGKFPFQSFYFWREYRIINYHPILLIWLAEILLAVRYIFTPRHQNNGIFSKMEY